MIEDIKSFFWFLLKGPKYYSTLWAQIYTKLRKSMDTPQHTETATNWCNENLTTISECLKNIGVSHENLEIDNAFDEAYKAKIDQLINSSSSNFGGQGHTNLIYTICERLNMQNVIETGVAYGWSSGAILKSLSSRGGQLISIDMPMLKQSDYHLIGVAVEPQLKDFWELRREPDRYGLPKAIKKMAGSIELVHYDSDKSYYGRKWSQEVIWKNLKSGGIFISDDIEDNTAFMEFVATYDLQFNVLEFEKKYVGVIKKEG